MTQDARQSLIALGSVTLFIGLSVVGLSLLRGVNIPSWVLPLGLVLMAIDFGWRFLRWNRAKRIASREDRA
jgi:hypothetical protein